MGLEHDRQAARVEQAANDNSPKEKIKQLEDTLSQLRLIKESLKIEERSRGEAARGLDSATKSETEASDEFMRAQMAGEPADVQSEENLARARENRVEATEFAHGLEENQTVSYDRYYNSDSLEEGAFAEKLKSLGVDLNAENVNQTLRLGAYDRAEVAIMERIHDLGMEIKDTKLEIDGEKERMAVELLQKSGALTEPVLAKFKQEAETEKMVGEINHKDGDESSVLKSIARHIRGGLREYPHAVEAAALEQVAREIYPDMDRQELKEKAQKLFESSGNGTIE